MANSDKTRSGVVAIFKKEVGDSRTQEILEALIRLPGIESVEPIIIGKYDREPSWLTRRGQRMRRATPPHHLMEPRFDAPVLTPAERMARRKHLQLSLAQVGEAIGCSASQVGNMESARNVHPAWFRAYDWCLEHSIIGKAAYLPSPWEGL
jgi:hypothetical protein